MRYGFALLMTAAAILPREFLSPNRRRQSALCHALRRDGCCGLVWRLAAGRDERARWIWSRQLSFVLPRNKFVLNAATLVGVVVYGISCLLIINLGEAACRAYERLQKQVAESKAAAEAVRRERERLGVALVAGCMGCTTGTQIAVSPGGLPRCTPSTQSINCFQIGRAHV